MSAVSMNIYLIRFHAMRFANAIRGGKSILVMILILLHATSLHAHGVNVPNSFSDLAEELSPAVVNITTTTVLNEPAQPNFPMVPKGSPFEDLFRDFFNHSFPQGKEKRPRKSTALGSGFVISADGYIVTNNHVIKQADEIMIEFLDGTELEATVIGRDANTDIALLKVTANSPLPFVGFGKSDIARVGDWVMAIGNPLGQGFSVSVGIISARNRTLQAGPYDDFIQTDAAINRGNSGGPLFNMDGQVIGVNTAIISPNGGSIGLAFAMSSKVVSQVVDQLKDFGETRRGWLGVHLQDLDADMSAALGLDDMAGAMISKVLSNSPAENGGMKVGDVILSFDGMKVDQTRTLVNAVGIAEVGKTVPVVVYRNGKTQTLQVILGRRETAEIKENDSKTDSIKPQKTEILGMTLQSLNTTLRQEFNVDDRINGVVITDLNEEEEAFDKGLRIGDVILAVEQKPVTMPSDVSEILNAAREAGRRSMLILINKNGNNRFMALSLK